MSIVLRSTVQRFFPHTEEGSQTPNVCVFQKQLTLLDVLNRTTASSAIQNVLGTIGRFYAGDVKVV